MITKTKNTTKMKKKLNLDGYSTVYVEPTTLKEISKKVRINLKEDGKWFPDFNKYYKVTKIYHEEPMLYLARDWKKASVYNYPVADCYSILYTNGEVLNTMERTIPDAYERAIKEAINYI